MPEISRFYGIIITMYYNDHNPPHFHLSYQGYRAVIEIKTGILKGEMPKTAIRLSLEWLELHQTELLHNWENMEEQKPMKKIEPLT
ncbi:MAG: DUF4160 domain-containing protein [Leeuwenhoekiella sp.]